jgi:hypothetical protein
LATQESANGNLKAPPGAVEQGRFPLNGTEGGAIGANSIPFSILFKFVCFSLDVLTKEFRIFAVYGFWLSATFRNCAAG